MLQNEYLVAKIGVDPAENAPSKVSLIPAQYQFYPDAAVFGTRTDAAQLTEADAGAALLVRQGADLTYDPGNCHFGPPHPFWRNFGRLVLACINTDFGNIILILQHFSRSTRFAFFFTFFFSEVGKPWKTHLCTTPNSEIA